MSTKMSYRIDFTANTVTITKAFADAANNPFSEEYKMLVELRNQGFSIVNKTHKPAKTKTPMPTYKQMEHYISSLAESEFYLQRYEAVLNEAKSHTNAITKVRKWFRATFPNYGKLPEFDEDNRIIVTPVDHDAETLKKTA
ncbi:MAG: hypothetical protein J6K32_10365 [Clostridia bacterium]|nr:hypothetical protein [Clostridia bacterium]